MDTQTAAAQTHTRDHSLLPRSPTILSRSDGISFGKQWSAIIDGVQQLEQQINTTVTRNTM